MTNQHHHLIDEFYAILLSLVGGARYGFKIRLPHALVTTVLFRTDLPTARDKLWSILKLALEHAASLASFAAIYKSILVILKWTHRHCIEPPTGGPSQQQRDGFFRSWGRALLALIVDAPFPGERKFLRANPGHPEQSHHALLAGALGGYLIWGRYSSVNNQVVLYLTSRVLVGLWKRHELGELLPPSVGQRLYSIAAALVWAVVMQLFEESPDVLHPSLKSSMDEIYRFRQSRKAGAERKCGS